MINNILDKIIYIIIKFHTNYNNQIDAQRSYKPIKSYKYFFNRNFREPLP